MYKIIGGDGNEYGPVSAEQLHQWIAEGRANNQTKVQHEGELEWKPLATFPEFAEALTAQARAQLGEAAATTPPPFSPGATAGSATLFSADGDYELDIGACISRSWEVLKVNFWPVLGISLLVFLAAGGLNQLIGLVARPAWTALLVLHQFSVHSVLIILATSFLSAPVYTVFMGGLFRYYLKLIRHEEARIGDAFSGFGPSLGQLILLGLVMNILTLVGILFCVLPGIYLSVAWVFALPLMVDRQMDFWLAMELSRKAVSKHWFIVFAMGLVAGLLSSCGILLCIVGVFATAPLGLLAMMCAYETIFSGTTARNN